MKVEQLDYTNENTGKSIACERYETAASMDGFEHGPQFKAGCEGCPQHANNFSCPPFSPAFADYIQGSAGAQLILYKLPFKYFPEVPDDQKYQVCFDEARRLLTNELLEYRQNGYKVAGSGGCTACEKCLAKTGRKNECIQPEKMVYSLESLGVNVVDLVKSYFGINLEWSEKGQPADFVCAVGAVILDKSKASAA